MTIEKDKWRLGHILEAIEYIVEFLDGKAEEEFYDDYELQLAITRLFEIIGEAASNITSEFKNSHPRIDWREATDMRNKMIHNYFEINLEVVWDTVKNDIPRLNKQIKEILKT